VPIPLYVKASDFINQVHRPLIDKLAVLGATADLVEIVSSDRLSLVLTTGRSARAEEGMDKQIALLADRFPDDPDVQEYSQLPAESFRYRKTDPERLSRDLATLGHQGCWLTYADLYPGQRDKPFGAAVLIGRQLFLRINASAAAREITTVDGSVHNAYGILQASIVRALGTRKTLRYSEDPMRFSRDTLAAERTIDACVGAKWLITFGTMTFAPNEGATSLMTLRGLSQIGQVENELRARKDLSHRLSRVKEGLTHLPEKQMPIGFRHAHNELGKRIRKLDAYVPEFDPAFAPVIEEAVRLHAQDVSYLAIGRRLAEYDVPVRGLTDLKGYQSAGEILSDATLSDVARADRLNRLGRSFFRIRTLEHVAWRNPGDPEATDVDLAFAEAYTGKLTLWSTGRYTTMRLLSVLRGTEKINGVAVLYLPGNEVGHLPMDCRWAIDSNGNSTLPLALDPDLVARSRERIYRERKPASPQGAAAHRRERVPWLPEVPTWLDGTYNYTDPPCDRQGQLLAVTVCTHRIRPTRASDGSVMYHCRKRPAHQSLRRIEDTWAEKVGFASNEGEQCCSFSGRELAASVALAGREAIGDALDGVRPAVLARPHRMPPASSALLARQRKRAEALLQRRERQHAGARAARDEARGTLDAYDAEGPEHLLLAGELERCDTSLQRAREALEHATRELAAIDQPEHDLEVADNGDTDAVVPLAVVAYLFAALERAGNTDGRVNPDTAALLAEHTTDWRFTNPTIGVVHWSCTLVWDADTHDAAVQLSGIIDNARQRAGRASGDTVRFHVLDRGIPVDELLASERLARQRSGVISGLQRHLAGLLPRKAIGPLLDHPSPELRRYIYRRGVLHQPLNAPNGWQENFATHCLTTYTDPSLEVRPGAAVPQRLDAWHALQTALLEVGGSAPIDAVARELGLPVEPVLNHLRNTGNIGIARLNPFKTTIHTVSLTPCPHADCRNPFASHLCALPEIVITGHSALCPSCRRVPDLAWAHLVVPQSYVTARWTRAIGVKAGNHSLFGPPNPDSFRAPSKNPAILLCQAQTVAWTGQPLTLPQP
jgi:hypothetical protein